MRQLRDCIVTSFYDGAAGSNRARAQRNRLSGCLRMALQKAGVLYKGAGLSRTTIMMAFNFVSSFQAHDAKGVVLYGLAAGAIALRVFRDARSFIAEDAPANPLAELLSYRQRFGKVFEAGVMLIPSMVTAGDFVSSVSQHDYLDGAWDAVATTAAWGRAVIDLWQAGGAPPPNP